MESDTSQSPILVSACLVGLETRYDGRAKPCEQLRQQLKGKSIIPVCPEQLGGLPTPRSKSQLVGGDGQAVLEGKARVVNQMDRDVTESFVRGARQVEQIVKLCGCRKAVLAGKSPSCGCGKVWVGGKLCEGDGVTTAVLKRLGVEIQSVDV